jgi:hypothetical protein
MKFVINTLFLLFLIVSCGKKSSPSSPQGQKDSTQSPDAEGTLSWGHWPCQKNETCSNEILNISKTAWGDFLQKDFPAESPVLEDLASLDEFQFLCGGNFYVAATGRLPALSTQSILEITQFAAIVLNIPSCQATEDLTQKMNTYLTTYLKEKSK